MPRRFVGAVLCALGLTVLAGWILRIPLLLLADSGQVTMVTTTACGLITVGIGTSRDSVRVRQVCGGFLLLLAAHGILNISGLLPKFLDLWFLHSWLTDDNPYPGRMAHNTTVAFIAAGLAMLVMDRVASRRSGWFVQLATVAVLAIGAIGLFGHALRLDLLYRGNDGNRMSHAAAAGIILSGVAIWQCWRNAAWYRDRGLFRDEEKVATLGAALVFIVALSAAVAGYSVQHTRFESYLVGNLATTLGQHVNNYRAALRSNDTHARLLALMPQLRESYQGKPMSVQLRDTLALALTAEGVTSLLVRAQDGRELVRFGLPSRSPKHPVALEEVPGATLFWDDGLRVRHVLQLAFSDGTTGVMEVERQMPHLDAFLLQPVVHGNTAESAMCARNGDRLACFPQRRRNELYTTALTASDGAKLPMAMATSGERGVMRGRDFRGRQVIAAYAPLDGTQLGMVIKQDSNELLAPLALELERALLLMLVLGAGAAWILRQAVHPLAARLARAEYQARSREERLRAVFDNVDEGIITMNAAGRIEGSNPAAARIFGYAQDQLSGLDVSDLMPSSARDAHRAGLARMRAGGEGRMVNRGAVRVEGLRADGGRVPIELAVSTIENGGERRFVGILRDITVREQAEAAIRRSHAELEREVAARTAELRAMAAHQHQLIEEERKRIARELHDELGAELSGIRAYLSYSERRDRLAGLPADAGLGEAGRLADDAIETVRRVITDLRPSVLDQLGLWAAIEWYAGQLPATLACEVDIAPDCQQCEVGPERSTALFRIVQESLTNVLRHAGATAVQVRARCTATGVTLDISDDGAGMRAGDTDRPGSWGILGMRERVRHFGGELVFSRAGASGTVVTVSMPLEEARG